MRCRKKSILLGQVVVLGLLVGSADSPARADDDGTRAVTIIDAPTSGAPAEKQPLAPPVTKTEPNAPALTPAGPPAAAMPAGPSPVAPASQTNFGPAPKPGDVGELPGRVKVANPAELSVDIIPGVEIPVGTLVSFRVSTRKQGYLLLVDVDATGKLTQIYPNPMSLLNARAGQQNSNLIKPGKPIVIPNPADAYAGFEFVASPPHGTAMVVALLSDRPVQMVDLPDIPTNLAGQAGAVTFLSNMAHELKIASGGPGQLQEARWSLDAKFYAVR